MNRNTLRLAVIGIVLVGLLAAGGCMASESDGPSETATTTTTTTIQTTTVEPITVSGTVLDPNLEEPLAGATVSLDGKEVQTDEDGEFEFEDIQSGQYQLSASKEGYTAEEISIEVSADESVEVALKNRLFYEPNETVLGSTHISEAGSCSSCHEAANAIEVTDEPERDSCLACHSETAVKNATASLEHNPHDDPHGYSRDCSSCHKVHTVSVNSCAECHPDDWIPQPP